MAFWKCDDLGPSFEEQACFLQQEYEKIVLHLNDVSYERPKRINPPHSMHKIKCSTCKISISGFHKYQTHVNSLEHAVKVQKKNTSFRSSYVASTFDLKTQRNHPTETVVPAFFRRDRKALSGLENYDHHLESTDHRKKCGPSTQILQKDETDSLVIKDNMNDVSYVASTFDLKTQRNHPTETVLPGLFGRVRKALENYNHHLESTDHRKKCGPSTQILQNDETDSLVIKDNMNDILPNYPQSSVFTGKVRETLPELFVKCNICEIEFSGAMPYLIHLVSNGHKTKVSNPRQSEFKCDICVMTFTGDVQYVQHLVSNGHKQNITAHLFKQLPATRALSPLDSSVKDSYIGDEQASVKDLHEWYCHACKIQCSGSIPYNTHIIDQEHLENKRIMLLEEKFKKLILSKVRKYQRATSVKDL